MKKAMCRWQYETAAQYTKAVATLNVKMAESGSIDLFLPVIMCQVLAIELLLKFMILYEREDILIEEDLKASGLQVRGHNLESLYLQLPPEMKSTVETHFLACRAGRMTKMNYVELIREVGKQPLVDLRYYCEKPTEMKINRDALDVLLESIGRTADEYFARLKP